MKRQQPILFSVALNGYYWVYRDCIESHRAYAKRMGYEYHCISRPFVSKLGNECCWFKISILLRLLRNGVENVVVLDADTMISNLAPSFDKVLAATEHLGMARGVSGEYNSGVMFIKNTSQTRHFLKQLLLRQGEKLGPDDPVGWGENGHIIDMLKTMPLATDLPLIWNNTSNPSLRDYIRHYNNGPMRTSVIKRLFHRSLSSTTSKLTKLIGLFSFEQHLCRNWLEQESNRIFKRYSL
ncbi:MAG: putative nucleotide-diphospho-sugar transferase [Arenicella sp.]